VAKARAKLYYLLVANTPPYFINLQLRTDKDLSKIVTLTSFQIISQQYLSRGQADASDNSTNGPAYPNFFLFRCSCISKNFVS
jgi:hypothetical protein